MELGSVAGVHGHLASHDQAILKQLSNVLACTKFIIKFCKLKERATHQSTERVLSTDSCVVGR